MVNDAFPPLTYAKNIVAAIASIGELASSRLLLQDCLLCGQSNEHGLLCDACENALPYLKTAYCPRCAGFSANSEVCGRCLKRKSIYFDSAKAVYHYEFPVDRLIHAFKYGHRLALGNYFGKSLADHVGPTDADLIVPMPLHPLRLKERGFNQALELAKHVGRRLGVAVDAHVCRRIRYTEAQVNLRWRKRIGNVRKAFVCEQDLCGKRILLIDDVMTSGASVNECARTLKAHGAIAVNLLLIARARTPGMP